MTDYEDAWQAGYEAGVDQAWGEAEDEFLTQIEHLKIRAEKQREELEREIRVLEDERDDALHDLAKAEREISDLERDIVRVEDALSEAQVELDFYRAEVGDLAS